MSRSAPVIRGTPDEMATPLMPSSNENPWSWRNWPINRACSSEVRSALVAMRQWSSSSSPPYRPTTVWVLPASMTSSTARLRVEVEVEPDVEDGGGVRQRPDGDQVGTRVDIRAQRLDRYVAGHFDGEPAVDDLHALGHLLGRHVVEQHEVGAGLDGGVDLVALVALHLHAQPRPAQPGAGHGLRYRQAGEVVVLDEHAVGKAAAMVDAAARAHRGLLEGAQAGGGLARVADARLAVRGPHVAPGEAGDARQVAQEVERRALAGEDRGQRPLDAADDLAGDDL